MVIVRSVDRTRLLMVCGEFGYMESEGGGTFFNGGALLINQLLFPQCSRQQSLSMICNQPTVPGQSFEKSNSEKNEWIIKTN